MLFSVAPLDRVKRQIWITAFITAVFINDYSTEVAREAWNICQREIVLLLEEIDAASSEMARTWLSQILHGRAGYDMDTVARALEGLNPKLWLKIDSAERSVFCGTKETR